MSNLPAPFTPPDCDLRGYEYMPLFGARLFNSDFEAHASDLAFRVAIRLYWESWQQVPAASLPNDDVKLCRLAGLGRDMKTWRKLRADGVLHGFILCSDDRIYHALIAEQALKAWESCRRKDRTRDQTAERVRRFREKKTNGQGEDVTRYEDRSSALRNAETDSGNASGNASRASTSKRIESRESTERLRRSAPADAAKTAAQEFHSAGLELAQQLLRLSPDRTRSFLGRLLKLADNNHKFVLDKLRECRRVHPIDPQSWLIAAVGHPFRRDVADTGFRNGALEVILRELDTHDNVFSLTPKAVGHG